MAVKHLFFSETYLKAYARTAMHFGSRDVVCQNQTGVETKIMVYALVSAFWHMSAVY